MQNSWEGLLEVMEVDEDTYHVKKSHVMLSHIQYMQTDLKCTTAGMTG